MQQLFENWRKFINENSIIDYYEIELQKLLDKIRKAKTSGAAGTIIAQLQNLKREAENNGHILDNPKLKQTFSSYAKQISTEINTGPTLGGDIARRQAAREKYGSVKAQKGDPRLVPPLTPELKVKLAKDLAWEVIKMVEPTGVASHQDLKDSVKRLKRNPTQATVLDTILQSLAVVPALGYFGKAGKVLRGSRRAVSVADARKVIKQGNSIADAYRVAGEYEKARKIRQSAKSLEGAVDEYVALSKKNKAAAAAPVAAAPAAARPVKFSFAQASSSPGRRMGVFYDGRRPFVNVLDSQGNMHTFMYSSGTSYTRIDPNTNRVLGMSPRTWIPVKDVSPTGVYGKYSPRDVGFGKGDPDLWKTLHRFKGEIGEEYRDYLIRNFGDDWAVTAAGRTPKSAQIRKVLNNAMNDGAFIRDTPRVLGKYPAPDSELGRISQELGQAYPDGNLRKLEDAFGRVIKSEQENFNYWRRSGEQGFEGAK